MAAQSFESELEERFSQAALATARGGFEIQREAFYHKNEARLKLLETLHLAQLAEQAGLHALAHKIAEAWAAEPSWGQEAEGGEASRGQVCH